MRVNLLSASSGNMLAEIRRGANDLSFAHVVVGNENDLEQIANILIVVHNRTHTVDEMNDLLRHPVSRGGLASEDGDARLLLLPLLWLHSLESQVAMDDTKDVELLALVLVDTLDLHIKEGSRVDSHTGGRLDELRQTDLVGVLDLVPFLPKLLVLSVLLEAVQKSQVLEEPVAAALGSDELRQARVGLVKPSTGSDSVGDIGKFVGTVNLNKILEDGRLDEIRVQLGNAIDLVGSNNGQEGHPHHLGLGLLDDGDT